MLYLKEEISRLMFQSITFSTEIVKFDKVVVKGKLSDVYYDDDKVLTFGTSKLIIELKKDLNIR